MTDTFTFEDSTDSSGSDWDGEFEGTEGVDADLDTGGTTESDGADANAVERFDPTEYSDRLVTVKVGGEEIEVPLSEALAGYQRQADYTRKTQELAEQARIARWGAAISEALQRDPQATLQALAEHHGVRFGQAPAAPANDDIVDPLERRIAEVEAAAERRFQEMQAAEQRRVLQGEVERLSATYPDFDVEEVVAIAMKEGGISLEKAYKIAAFERQQVRLAELEAAERKRAADAQRIEAKRKAARTAGGHSPRAGETDAPIDDFWAAARASGFKI